MRNLPFLLLCFFLVNSCSNHQQFIPDMRINSMIGDVSFVNTFGFQPDASVNEDLRIQTHLLYVENLLRNKKVSNLDAQSLEKRHHLLDLLHDYAVAGIFPRNHDHPEGRFPCFIDRDGRICAVGYLVEQTAGREVAEYINGKFKYEKVMDMEDEQLDAWIASSGLTKEECATIQPSYWGAGTYNQVNNFQSITTGTLSGINLSVNTINLSQIAKGKGNKVVPVIGLVFGGLQTIAGFDFLAKSENDLFSSYNNTGLRNVSMLNIGLGTSTVLLSTYNLIANRKRKEKSLSWNLFGYPSQSNGVGLGFNLVKRF